MKMSKNKMQIKEISTVDEGSRLFKIIVIILILFAIFYFLTGNKRNNKIDNTPVTAVIQYDKIMIGEILNQSPLEYYVLLNKNDDPYQSLYDSYITTYKNEGDHLDIYTVDLDDSFNKKYLSEEENLQPEKISDFRIHNKALLKITNHKITNVYQDDAIASELKELAQ